jgi:hypothetical protein
MKYIGVTRFSLFTPGSLEWKSSRETAHEIESYKKELFKDDRLKARSYIFFNLSLPILQELSKKYDYEHIILYSPELPPLYSGYLEDIGKKYPFIKVLCTTENDRYQNQNNLIKNIIESSNYCKSIFGLFNLDDDDLLSVDYFDLASKYMLPQNEGMIVSLCAGLTGIFNISQKKIKLVRDDYTPKINIGLLKICHYSAESKKIKIPKISSHMTADLFAPVILDARNIGYFWLRSNIQDTLFGNDISKNIKSLESSLLKRKLSPTREEILLKFPTLKLALAELD